MAGKDIAILRELTRNYLEICNDDIQDTRRDLWRRQNSLKLKQPLIYVRAFAWREMAQATLECEDPLFRSQEEFLKRHIFWASFGDDSIFEPWVNVRASFKHSGWGLEVKHSFAENMDENILGAYKDDYPIKELDDIEKMLIPRHEIDEKQTAENVSRVRDAIGDLITVNADRTPYYYVWNADISTMLGHLRGIEHFMMDMMLNPDWLHRLLAFMRDGILKAHDEAERAGDWGLTSHYNQAMAYAEELADPVPNKLGVRRNELWNFTAAQEYTAVSPEMHYEFMLQYQIPIMEKFALTSYGCCEDLTNKIDMVRKIPNLRRIAVAPVADVAKCSAQIGEDYVLSYRPSPADMVSYQWDPERVRKILRDDLQHCLNSHVDITLKDVETVEKDPERIGEWVKLTREIIDELWG